MEPYHQGNFQEMTWSTRQHDVSRHIFSWKLQLITNFKYLNRLYTSSFRICLSFCQILLSCSFSLLPPAMMVFFSLKYFFSLLITKVNSLRLISKFIKDLYIIFSMLFNLLLVNKAIFLCLFFPFSLFPKRFQQSKY